MPKVSVIVPTFNREKFLLECIASIQKQSFTDFEIIVSDNASTDNTQKLVLGIEDTRIVYHRNDVNIGATLNHNQALKLCKGKYIQIFSDDDIMLDGCLEKNVAVLDKYPTVGLVHSDINIINGNDEITSQEHWAKMLWKKWDIVHSASKKFSNIIYHSYLYRIHNIICMPTVMIRQSVINKIGYMDPGLKYYIDWHYWLKITLFYDVYYINEKLVSYRIHRANFFGAASAEELLLERRYVKSILARDYPQQSIVKNDFLTDFLEQNKFHVDYNYLRISKSFILHIIKSIMQIKK